jgi:hypothetical protein
MRGSLDQPPIIVVAPRAQSVWLLIVCLILLAISVLLSRGWPRPETLFYPYSGVIFFGGGLVAGVFGILRPPMLIIGPEGIRRYSAMQKKPVIYRWQDIDHFATWDLRTRGEKYTYTGFAYSKKHAKGPLAKANTFLSGLDVILESRWGLRPKELCELLNSALARWKDPNQLLHSTPQTGRM